MHLAWCHDQKQNIFDNFQRWNKQNHFYNNIWIVSMTGCTIAAICWQPCAMCKTDPSETGIWHISYSAVSSNSFNNMCLIENNCYIYVTCNYVFFFFYMITLLSMMAFIGIHLLSGATWNTQALGYYSQRQCWASITAFLENVNYINLHWVG